MSLAWGQAFKTLCGLDGRTESVQGWIYSVSQKACPQARLSFVALQNFHL